MAYQSFEDLEVWKRGCQLAVYVYECLQSTNDYGLRSQMQRAAVSIPSNIAEGSERSRKEFSRFLQISLGSNAELRTQAYIGCKIGLLTADQRKHIVQETKDLGRMMRALSRTLTPDPTEN